MCCRGVQHANLALQVCRWKGRELLACGGRVPDYLGHLTFFSLERQRRSVVKSNWLLDTSTTLAALYLKCDLMAYVRALSVSRFFTQVRLRVLILNVAIPIKPMARSTCLGCFLKLEPLVRANGRRNDGQRFFKYVWFMAFEDCSFADFLSGSQCCPI